jgi:LysM repeat protein
MKFITLIATTAIAIFAAGAEACSGRVRVAAGDTFDGIAARGRISSAVLQYCNRGQDPRTLQIGQVIAYPVCRRSRTYYVKQGDTLWDLGVRFNVGLGGMLDCNAQLPNPDSLYPGQPLQIPY